MTNSIVLGQTFKIVGTGQTKFYNNSTEIAAPAVGADFYGQDATHNCYQPQYHDNGDGTVTDLVTGLMWQRSADRDGDGDIGAGDKLTYDKAVAGAKVFRLGGYTDWRLPTIKELYSLIVFSGIDPSGWQGSDTSLLTPFINTSYFDFAYGDLAAGERLIDAQYVSVTKYSTTTMINDETAFGVNFADGRIKGYGLMLFGSDKTFFVKYVRGNTLYGINDYQDNRDGTITDRATGLMWQQSDSRVGLKWKEALMWVQQRNAEHYLGYSDWRLPNVKELQSIVDYTRTPKTTNSPAIDSLFFCSRIADEGGGTTYPYYWSGTTHANMMNGGNAAYVSFGQAFGWMRSPSGSYQLLDVHGAGAQRSDPKTGDPADYPYGHGPQGDVIRIYNYVRLVRDAGTTEINGRESDASAIPLQSLLSQNYPNPFNPSTSIQHALPFRSLVALTVFNTTGQEVARLVQEEKEAGCHEVRFDAAGLSSGVYFYALRADDFVQVRKLVLLR